MSGSNRWSQQDVDIIFTLKYSLGWPESEITKCVATHYGGSRIVRPSSIRYVLRSKRPSDGILTAPKGQGGNINTGQGGNINTGQSISNEGNQPLTAPMPDPTPNIGDNALNQPAQFMPAVQPVSAIEVDPSVFVFGGLNSTNSLDNGLWNEMLDDSGHINMPEDETAGLGSLPNLQSSSAVTDESNGFGTSDVSPMRQNQNLSSDHQGLDITQVPNNSFGGVAGSPVAGSSQNFENTEPALDPLFGAEISGDISITENQGILADSSLTQHQEAPGIQNTPLIPLNESGVPELTINLENPEFDETFGLSLDLTNWIISRPDETTISLQAIRPTGKVTINLKNPIFHSGAGIS